MRKFIQPAIAAATFALAGLLASAPALAEYPEKPIKVIVPYSPGGTSDVITRIMTRHLEKALGQKVVIVNVNGGGGAVGWKRTQKARPDGYTLGVSVDSIAVMESTGASDFTYDSFDHVAMWGNVFLTVFSNGDGPYKNLADYKAGAMKAPGKVGLAMGNGTPAQFIAALVEEGLGADINLINVGGGAQKKAAVLGGHVDAAIEPTPGIIKQARAGQFNILAILAKERLQYLPDVPTAYEQGVEVEAFLSYGLMAPKGTPPDRIAVIANAMKGLGDIKEMQDQNKNVNMVWNFKGTAEYLEHLKTVRARMQRIGKVLGY
ncbi:MAG: tripartite-type tricarboxylate transporter receptor subunit TctC [Gammaproteobacteria bacterium]|jgi:tripartite-type tricarboxylate transporter receptor subunit TctC